eukprot:1184566-Pleurochrysis_carterae.AAC.1
MTTRTLTTGARLSRCRSFVGSLFSLSELHVVQQLSVPFYRGSRESSRALTSALCVPVPCSCTPKPPRIAQTHTHTRVRMRTRKQTLTQEQPHTLIHTCTRADARACVMHTLPHAHSGTRPHPQPCASQVASLLAETS